jgi:predicted alpha/beta-hydrolase family hydrolase
MAIQESRITFPVGEGAVSGIYSRPGQPFATLVVAHGAGSGLEHPFLAGFTAALYAESVATLRFNFPYREAGRKFPDRPPAAVAAWRAAMEAAGAYSDGGPLWAAGKSYGGRMASMAVAEGMPAAGLVYLGYPLHPPGKPEKIRDEHLYGLSLPMLFLQGTRDPFATPELLEAVVARIGPGATLRWCEGAGHTFDVAGLKRSPEAVGAALAGPVAAFMRQHVQ